MRSDFKRISGGVCAPKGFKASAVQVPIRKLKKDLALIVSEKPAAIAGVFTRNRVAAAPIEVCKAQLKKSSLCSAVVVNSGNANACTGEKGLQDAWAIVRETAKTLGVPDSQVFVGSTGVIGQFLPIDGILAAIPNLCASLSRDGGGDVAEAIMTTDTAKKEMAIEFELEGKSVRIGGVAKGAGMIAPNMGTMLAFITTDINIAQPLLQKALSAGVQKSFNRVSVDGDESTNDMALLLANGLADNALIAEEGDAFERFQAALEFVMVELAKLIARDGEGATKFVEITVSGARSEHDAEVMARTVANSSLVKTALHGEDPNWGRIIAALGYSRIDFLPEKVEIYFGDAPVLKQNFQIVLDEAKAKAELSKRDVSVRINLNLGECSATFWTCDLSEKYVEINGSYRS
ncbi:MAG: bifunctional glutamate N-acetyltransferase/amino-acid acetyltransferase ArgJ [Chloroherpetonaceae bacterium]|nr:bifunctional glutamate N-acetyltransferase/amino-acid acetyltransferase ArgJ [Chloroherpetonaceae bacterium]MDW8438586.1 bifunctional glutamate N-acetyltransferase/amino-acid acetyltransferase ArgJ [Chloroherpetonaceae bacterium]